MHIQRIDSKDPRLHAQNLSRHIKELKDYFRDEWEQLDDQEGRNLFKETADKLEELEKGLQRFQNE